MQFRNKLAKLLDNPITVPILQLLTIEQLTIPQITKSLQNIDADMPTVIAVLGELFHFGLVEQIQSPMLNISPQKQISTRREEKHPFKEYRLISPTPLGIPIHDYVALWEEILQHPDQSNFSEMRSVFFSLPEDLRKELKDLTLEEIRDKLLNRG